MYQQQVKPRRNPFANTHHSPHSPVMEEVQAETIDMDAMDTEYYQGEEQSSGGGFKMSDVSSKQEKLVVTNPFKANTLGAHTQPRGRAPPLPRTTPPKENLSNPFKRVAPPPAQIPFEKHTPPPMPSPQTFDEDDMNNQIPIQDSPEPKNY
jgi:hypothetical protein